MNEQRKNPDDSLKSGERQVATKIKDIDKLHVWRYLESLVHIREDDFVLDVGCGTGYGSYLIGTKADRCMGVDDSKETIQFARNHWADLNVAFERKNILDYNASKWNVGVAFEIVEHVKDDKKLVDHLKGLITNRIIVSVPHIDVPVSRSSWHWKHYSEETLKTLFEDNNWKTKKIFTKTEGKMKDVFAVFDKESE